MFNFTTTTILNSNEYLDGSKIFETLNDVNGNPMFQVKGLGNFYLNDQHTGLPGGVISVTRKVYSKPQKATATVGIGSAITATGNYFLKIALRLTQDSQSSFFANDLAYKGKPYIYEFKVKPAEVATVAAKVAGLINETYIKFQDVQTFKATTLGTNVILTGVDEFIKFFEITLSKLDTTSPTEEYVNVPLTITTTNPKSGFGTYKYLSENIKMPSGEWVQPGGLGQDEAPSRGLFYDQYTLKFQHTRPALGGANAVGEKVTSVTTHVFYVANSGAAATKANPKPAPVGTSLEFKNEIAALGIILDEITAY